MAISMANLRRVTATEPPRVLIYGPAGLGKTTLASEFPAPVFLQVENGTPKGVELDTFGHLQSYQEVMGYLQLLYNDEHNFRTVVIDSLDKLEPLVWEATCERERFDSIEAPGYGKGYVAADHEWRELIKWCGWLRQIGMNVVFIAHSTVNAVNDPRTVEYSQYNIRLHKRALALFQDEVDMILFLNQEVSIIADDPKDKSSRVRGTGSGNTWMYAQPRPAFVAKSRYGHPDKMLYTRGSGYAALAEHFPAPAPISSNQREAA